MKSQFDTVEKVADAMIALVDSYWKLEISEQEYFNGVADVFLKAESRGIVMRGLNFKSAFERKLGKRRLAELIRALIKIEPSIFGGLKK